MERSAQVEILKQVLEPFVQFCLRNSLAIQDVVDVAKIAFVESAARQLEAHGKKVNVSRLSVLTGLYRKDVTRIFRHRGGPREESVSILARVVGQWRHDQRFITKSGKPRILSFKGKTSEFKALVESVSKSINPGTILFELERMGALKREARGVQLLWQMPSFAKDPKQGFKILAADLDILMRSVEENLFVQDQLSNLHIRTEYDNIITKAVPEIKVWLLEEGKAFHKRAREFLSQFDKDLAPGLTQEEGGAHVVVSAFGMAKATNISSTKK